MHPVFVQTCFIPVAVITWNVWLLYSAIVWQWLVVSLLHVAGIWMVHTEGQRFHLAQLGPLSMAINCWRQSLCPGVPAYSVRLV